MRPGFASGFLAVAVAAAWAPAPAAGQTIDSQEESRRLREASSLEWRGRVEDAEKVLVSLLQGRPTSSGGLFALERILRNLGRVSEVLHFADRYLEADPAASGVRYMKLRVLVEVDSLTALEGEARRWFAAEPDSPDPYREVSRLYERALGPDAALQVLEEGRATLGRSGTLALEVGDLRAELGDEAAAVEEWAVALRSPQADVAGVLRRLDRLEGDPTRLAPPLLNALVQPPTTPDRRSAAVRVALQLGLEDEALRTAREAARELSGSERRSFLADVSRRADEAESPAVALWALREERETASERERRTLDVRIATAALLAGDTAEAVSAQTRLARSLPVGSVERRSVVAELIRVEAATASRETLVARLEGFRNEYPDAPELDELVAFVAAGLSARGQVDAARQVLADAVGPSSALEAAFLDLQAGALERGREGLEEALPGLAPSRATEVLRLLAVLDRVGPVAGEALAVASALGHHGAGADGVETLVDALARVPDEDRPALMAVAGDLSLRGGDDERAEEFLAALVEGYPDAAEFPDAALALARLQLGRGDADAARTVLERLILSRPGSPVVPAARRELQRIRRGEPSGAWGGWR